MSMMSVVDYWQSLRGKDAPVKGVDFTDYNGNNYTKIIGIDPFSTEEVELLWPYCVKYKLIIPELDINAGGEVE